MAPVGLAEQRAGRHKNGNLWPTSLPSHSIGPSTMGAKGFVPRRVDGNL